MFKMFAAGLLGLGAVSSAHAGQRLYGTETFGTGSNSESHFTSGYTRSNGTYVEGYQSTNRNGTQFDNYGTRGNYDPYTGNYGTRNPQY